MNNSSVVDASLSDMLKRLLFHIGPRRKKQLLCYIFLILISSLFEVISMGSIIPFLSAISDGNGSSGNFHLDFMPSNLSDLLPTTLSLSQLLLLFVLAFLLSSVIRLFTVWLGVKLSFSIGMQLGEEIFKKYINQPYEYYLTHNSSEAVNVVATKINSLIYETINPTLFIMSSSILVLLVSLTLFVISPVITCSIFFGIGIFYFLIIKITRVVISKNSIAIASSSTKLIKVLQEATGGIREIMIDGTQGIFCSVFVRANDELRAAQARNNFISISPRYLVEAVGVSVIAYLAMDLSIESGGVGFIIPVLGVFVLCAQKLLPIIQQTYGNYISLRGSERSLKDTLEILAGSSTIDNSKSNVEIQFNDAIRIKSLSFRYSGSNNCILSDINLIIKKGERLGVIGASGAGKSTFINVLMGLLSPTSGYVSVDNIQLSQFNNSGWYRHLSHVPQVVYLSDDSIASNIAFGVPSDKIDMNLVRAAATKAQLSDAIDKLGGYGSPVGERGIRLSGGQRQRIGIARALYKGADVIVLDEATSALDDGTESSVMESIHSLDKELTLIIVAHKLATLKNCSKIIEIVNGKLKIRDDIELNYSTN